MTSQLEKNAAETAAPQANMNQWALATAQAERKDWHAALALAELALADAPRAELLSQEGSAVERTRAFLEAARWAQAADEDAATARYAVSALRELELRGVPNQETPWDDLQDLRYGIDLLASVMSAEEGAEILDQLPDLFGRMFDRPWYLHNLADSPKIDWRIGFEMVKQNTPFSLAQWCMARGRPNWAAAILNLVPAGPSETDLDQSARARELAGVAATNQAELKRRLNLLAGPIRLAENYTRETRLFAWPGEFRVNYGEAVSDGDLGMPQVPARAGMREISSLSEMDRELIKFVDNCRVLEKDKKPRWERKGDLPARFGIEESSKWWVWRTATVWLSLLSSPIPWLIVWLLPSALFLLAMGAGDLVGWSVHAAAATPTAWALAFIVWAIACSRCRVIRFLRIEATHGRVAWIAVPIPIHRLATLETDTIDATRTDEYVQECLEWLKFERMGDFVSIAGVHHRLSNIETWARETSWSGFWGVCFGLAAVFVLPAVGIAGVAAYDRLKVLPTFADAIAAPVFVILFVVICLAWLVAVAALFAATKLVATGHFRQAEYRVGYIDRHRKFRAVSAHYNERTAGEVFKRLQILVSEATK